MTTIHPPRSITTRPQPQPRRHRGAYRIAAGVVITLNALTAICWPQVVELVASYR